MLVVAACEPYSHPVGVLVKPDNLFAQVVAVFVEAAQQPPVQRVVGAEPITERLLGGGAAVPPVHVAQPACRGANLVEVTDIVLYKVAYGRRVQDDPGPLS